MPFYWSDKIVFWSEPHITWKDCYDLVREGVKAVCEEYKFYKYAEDIPVFTPEQEDFLDDLCKSNKEYNFIMKSFYGDLYNLILLPLKEEKIPLTNLIYFGKSAGHYIANFVELEEKQPEAKEIIDNIINTITDTVSYIAGLAEKIEAVKGGR